MELKIFLTFSAKVVHIKPCRLNVADCCIYISPCADSILFTFTFILKHIRAASYQRDLEARLLQPQMLAGDLDLCTNEKKEVENPCMSV